MATINRGPVKVFVETGDGVVREITGYVESFTFETDVHGYVRAYLEVIGVNDPIMYLTSFNLARKVEESHISGEWACTYCGHINPRSVRVCGAEEKTTAGCGASRSFIYGT